MEEKNNRDFECCPSLNQELWDDKIFEWQDKTFIKAKVFTLFYMPVNFGKVMRRLDKKIRESGAAMPDWMCLSDHTSKWNMDIYLAVDKEIPGEENITFSGKYYSRVYDGPFGDTGKWCNDFEARAKVKDLVIKKLFMWYTTCPKCAKKYGKNPVVIIGKVE